MGTLAPTRTGFSIKLKSPHIIGRAAGVNLRLTFREVSGNHAVIEWREDQWMVMDLKSSNGTLLNGERLEPELWFPLEEEDELAFGHADLVYELTDVSPPA